MLVFIVPLKSARVADSWEQVSKLFCRTIASACAQTSAEFRIVVACHEIPQGDFSNPNLEFIQVPYPAPSTASFSDLRLDKKHKRFTAFTRALEYSPNHVMFLDADDLVSNRLAQFVADHSAANGWYLRSGYFFCEKQALLHRERWRFHKWCGSSYIVRPEHLAFLLGSDERILYSHRWLDREMRRHGTPLRPLPFSGAIYTVAHGDSFRDYESLLWPSHPVMGPLRRMIFHRPVTPQIQQEFGLA